MKLIFLISILIVIFIPLYAFVIEPNWLRIKKLEYNKTNASEEIHVISLADLHVGSFWMTYNKLDEIVSLVNSMNPDVVLLPGDIIDASSKFGFNADIEITARIISKIQAPVFAVLGNHDWSVDGEKIKESLEANNIKVLENETIKIDLKHKSIYLTGLEDDSTRKPDYELATKHLDTDPDLIMMHDPGTWIDIPDHVQALSLAGHTHAGQVRIPFYGAIIVPGRSPRNRAWGYSSKGNSTLFVSSGIGTSNLPIRFLARPEIISLYYK